MDRSYLINLLKVHSTFILHDNNTESDMYLFKEEDVISLLRNIAISACADSEFLEYLEKYL